MTFIKQAKNENNTPISIFICDFCKEEYSVCPAIIDSYDIKAWDDAGCTSENCRSYDPHRDAEVLFMTNKEIAKEKKIISISNLRKRREL